MIKHLLVVTALVSLVPSAVSAAINLNLDYPVIGPFNLNTTQNIGEVIGFLYGFLVVIAGVLAFGMLVWAGITWLASAGDPSKISDARDRIQKAFLGLLLVLASFLLLQILNPDLTLITTP